MGEVVLKRLYFYISTMKFVKMSTMSFQVNLMPKFSSNKCSPAVG